MAKATAMPAGSNGKKMMFQGSTGGTMSKGGTKSYGASSKKMTMPTSSNKQVNKKK